MKMIPPAMVEDMKTTDKFQPMLEAHSELEPLEGAVALDIDGVLMDAISAGHAWLVEKTGLPPDQIRKTGIWGRPFESAYEIPQKLLQGIWTREEVICGMQPLPGAIELCSRLADTGRLSSYITRRNPSVSRFTWASLLTHGFPYAPIHHVGGLCSDTGEDLCKTEFAKRYQARVLIDDNVDEAARALRNGFVVIMPAQPWNADWTPTSGRDRFHRTSSHLQTMQLLGLRPSAN